MARGVAKSPGYTANMDQRVISERVWLLLLGYPEVLADWMSFPMDWSAYLPKLTLGQQPRARQGCMASFSLFIHVYPHAWHQADLLSRELAAE